MKSALDVKNAATSLRFLLIRSAGMDLSTSASSGHWSWELDLCLSHGILKGSGPPSSSPLGQHAQHS